MSKAWACNQIPDSYGCCKKLSRLPTFTSHNWVSHVLKVWIKAEKRGTRRHWSQQKNPWKSLLKLRTFSLFMRVLVQNQYPWSIWQIFRFSNFIQIIRRGNSVYWFQKPQNPGGKCGRVIADFGIVENGYPIDTIQDFFSNFRIKWQLNWVKNSTFP